ncbi:hypothetical protein HB779_04650 [Phyllobacterium sp. 628]|uniref:hypothetical protein n=1 Tax=Phyllobacterium sp. 628 TaxID=2718938 RepID=UPI00166249C0|nr:hypothetical protein [Phyllobacterium sp. 628]QND51266.1 hypothetical protein HB779_04650 [Phyllobacterium sp. 628]
MKSESLTQKPVLERYLSVQRSKCQWQLGLIRPKRRIFAHYCVSVAILPRFYTHTESKASRFEFRKALRDALADNLHFTLSGGHTSPLPRPLMRLAVERWERRAVLGTRSWIGRMGFAIFRTTRPAISVSARSTVAH